MGYIKLALIGTSFLQTAQEIKRSKATFCVGMFSCFIVVTVAAVIQSLLSSAPVIFLREAENSQGQRDLVLTASAYTSHFFLNYSQFEHALESSNDPLQYSYHSPRLVLSGIDVLADAACPASYSRQDNSWMYEPPPTCGDPCSGCDCDCLAVLCDTTRQTRASFFAIDTAREQRMEYGRQWALGEIPEGQVVLRSSVARAIGVDVGDTVILRLVIPLTLRHALAFPHADAKGWADLSDDWGIAVVPFKIFAVITDSGGKVPTSTSDASFVEYKYFVRHVARNLHPLIRANSTQASPLRANPDGNMYHFASLITLNMPPEKRLAIYTSSNYDTVQSEVVKFVSAIKFTAGFSQINSDTPVLNQLYSRRFVTLYLGLILDILMFILFALSTILIYSLLMINVQARTFELAVRRTLGTSKPVLVLLLLMQAMSYSIPSWIVGLVAAEFLTQQVMKSFANLSGVSVSSHLSARAVLVATALAIAIPLAAAIIPIHAALAESLRDALDVERPKTSAVKYHLERSNDGRISWSIIVIGAALAIFGFMIYYLLPLSLLSLNLSLFFNIFFWILICMLLGMVLLAMNVEIPLERALSFLFLWWERAVVVQLAVANLIAHRLRNRKTMIMYALSVSFIVFINVAANQEIQSAELRTRASYGAPLSVTGPTRQLDYDVAKRLESAVRSSSFSGIVEGSAWISHGFDTVMKNLSVSSYGISNFGHLYTFNMDLRGVSPNVYDVMYSEFTRYGQRSDSGLLPSEELYTTRGSQSVVLSASIKYELDLYRGTPFLIYTAQDVNSSQPLRLRTVVKPQTTLEYSAFFRFSGNPSSASSLLVSFPTQYRLTQDRLFDLPLSATPMNAMLVRLSNSATKAQIDDVRAALDTALVSSSGWSVRDIRRTIANLEVTVIVLNFLFGTLTVVAMFLCYFSLFASMITNIHEQKKEIGVLLAIGLRPSALIRAYVYEAFLIVLAASLMGVLIGCAAAWTFAQQRSLFTQLPLTLQVPWGVIVVVVLFSVICAALAAWGPARRLTKVAITKLLRSL